MGYFILPEQKRLKTTRKRMGQMPFNGSEKFSFSDVLGKGLP
jgi:hypothetical protein